MLCWHHLLFRSKYLVTYQLLIENNDVFRRVMYNCRRGLDHRSKIIIISILYQGFGKQQEEMFDSLRDRGLPLKIRRRCTVLIPRPYSQVRFILIYRPGDI